MAHGGGLGVRAALGAALPASGDVQVRLHFMVRPRRQGDAPDLDKLVRAVLDALTGIAYLDDKQVVAIAARRTLLPTDCASSPGLPQDEGVAITLEPLP